jgi:Helix-turn-helix domain
VTILPIPAKWFAVGGVPLVEREGNKKMRPVSSKRIALLLHKMRLESGLTLRQLEARSGVSNAYLSQLEGGRVKEPSPHMLYRLALVYAAPGGTALRACYRMLFIAAGYKPPDV